MASITLFLIFAVGCSAIAFRLALGHIDQLDDRLKKLTERVGKLERSAVSTANTATLSTSSIAPANRKQARKLK